MRPSVIQLRQLVFKGIHLDPVDPTEDSPPIDASSFDFEGVIFRVNLGCEPLTAGEEGDDPSRFVIILGIALDNTERKPAPYLLDITALGLIAIDEKVEPEKRTNLAAINGASLIYGAIRELVTTLSARSVAGPFVLPTMDFRDHLPPPTDPPEAP